jgi:hypothetical protein
MRSAESTRRPDIGLTTSVSAPKKKGTSEGNGSEEELSSKAEQAEI